VGVEFIPFKQFPYQIAKVPTKNAVRNSLYKSWGSIWYIDLCNRKETRRIEESMKSARFVDRWNYK